MSSHPPLPPGFTLDVPFTTEEEARASATPFGRRVLDSPNDGRVYGKDWLVNEMYKAGMPPIQEELPPLPQGFIPDNTPPLPEGFVIDRPAPEVNPLTALATQDVGPEDIGLVDRVKRGTISFGTAALGGVSDVVNAVASQLGYVTADEAKIRAWTNMSPEERKADILRSSGESIGGAVVETLSLAGKALGRPTWLIPERAQTLLDDLMTKKGVEAGQSAAELFNRIEVLEKEKVLPGFWTQDLPHALGTTATIGTAALASGIASGGAVPAWAAAAYLGASLGMDEAAQDAMSHGATPTQAVIAAGVGTLLGTTEALPVTKVLDRLDTATGGIISKRINQVVKKKLVGNALKEGLKGAFEEGLQEAFQTVGNDAVAALTYDPDRPITGRMVDAALAGGGTGFILSAITTALGIPLRNRQQEKIRQDLIRQDAERVTGQPLTPQMEQAIRRNAPFTPLTPAYFNETKNIQETLDRLELIVRNGIANPGATVQQLRDQLGGPIGTDFSIGFLRETDFYDNADKFSINPKVETDLPGTQIREELSNDMWTYNPGAAPGEDFLWAFHDRDGQIIGGINNPGENGKVFIAEVLGEDGNAKNVGTFDNPMDGRLAIEKHFGTLQKVIHSISAADALKIQPVVVTGFDDSEVTLAKELKNLVAGVREKYLDKNTKIILSGSGFTQGPNQFGAMWTADNGRLIHIGVNTDLAGSHRDIKGSVTETLLHELGHAIVAQRFTDIVARVKASTWKADDLNAMLSKPGISKGQQLHLLKIRELQEQGVNASQKDFITYHAVMTEYKSWLEKQLKNPFLNRFRTISPPTSLQYWLDSADSRPDYYASRPSDIDADIKVDYFYNFDEFMAENFARVATQHQFATEGAGNFFREHRAILEKMYQETANLDTMPAFTDWIRLMSYEGKLEAKIKELAGKEYDRYTFLRSPRLAKELGLDENFFSFDAGNDNYQRWYSIGLNILQLGRLNPHIESLQDYIRFMQVFNQKIGEFRWRGHNTLREWRKIGPKQATILSEILYDETLRGKPYDPGEMQLAGLHPDSLTVYKQIKQDFAVVMERIEKVLMAELRQNFYNDPVTLQQETAKLRDELDAMKARPFFPLMRFGRYTVQVRATEDFTSDDGKKYKKGQLVEFLTYERKKHRTRDLGDVKSRWAGKPVSFGEGYLTDAQVAVQGMQGPILRSLRKKLSDAGELTPEMEEAIKEQLQESLSIDSFRRHFSRRRKVKGFSQDALRSYATYVVQAATHLARIEMQADLNNAVNEIARDSREITKMGGNGTKRGQIADMTRSHLNYVMNPGNDWPTLRSIGFAWFMGFNLKSALVNSTQLFVATHPYLAARYGDLDTSAALSKAVYLNTKYLAGKGLSQDVQELLARGKAEGWLDESFATELAVARSSKSLADNIPVTSGARIWTKFSEIMAWPFHTVEKMNRNLTAIAAHQLALSRGLNQQQAIALAREAVQATQFEYARWARPALMRGKVGSNVFLFKNFMQNQLFLALGKDPAAGRVLFSMLVLAGMMGLPFAEDLLDLLDAAGTKLKRVLGWENPKVQSRQFVREMLMELEMNPDLFMYGLSESSMGLGYLGDLAGFPIPEIDLQGSLSSGNVIPGTQSLKRLQEGEPGMAFLQFMEELGGAEASYMADIAQALLVDNPDTWKRWETSLPAFLKSLSRAGRYASRGGEFTARGQPIAEFDHQDAQDQMEVALQLLGFTPSKVSRGWEAQIAEREIVTYYEAWKRALLRNHNWARLYGDPDLSQNAIDAIREYNNDVPYPELKISADSLKRSLESFAQQRALAGQSIPQQRQNVRISREIQDLYSE